MTALGRNASCSTAPGRRGCRMTRNMRSGVRLQIRSIPTVYRKEHPRMRCLESMTSHLGLMTPQTSFTRRTSLRRRPGPGQKGQSLPKRSAGHQNVSRWRNNATRHLYTFSPAYPDQMGRETTRVWVGRGVRRPKFRRIRRHHRHGRNFVVLRRSYLFWRAHMLLTVLHDVMYQTC